MQSVLLDIWRTNKTTMIFVTHDIDEAVYLGNRVVILEPRPGKIRRIVPIDLPYPRKKATSSFQEMRLRVLHYFEKVDELEMTDGAGI
ncbi:Aliphatic sulfonates import ATP-binding protein SsuB [compost metagenome]